MSRVGAAYLVGFSSQPVESLLNPNDAQRLPKVIVNDLTSPLGGATPDEFGPSTLRLSARIECGDNICQWRSGGWFPRLEERWRGGYFSSVVSTLTHLKLFYLAARGQKSRSLPLQTLTQVVF